MNRAMVGVVFGSALLCAVPAFAQRSATGEPAFDVASIKPNKTGALMIRTDTEGRRFIGTNVPVRTLVRIAYGLEDFQIVGAPSWMNDDRFDVLANASRELPPMSGPFTGPPALQLLMRSLLAERFGLVARTETREQSMFALTLAGTDGGLGPDLARSQIDCAAETAKRAPADGAPPCGIRISPGSVVLEGVPMSLLADTLAVFVGRKVVDRTGLNGTFDLQLHWTGPAAGDGPSLFTALREQAGLKVEPTRGELPVLVIDRIQPPTPN